MKVDLLVVQTNWIDTTAKKNVVYNYHLNGEQIIYHHNVL
jgi:hypothetical protein